MGAPAAPSIVQQTVQPTADEKQAAKVALQQKTAALTKINQDVFARSQGLRGAASMYDWAGPTPHLAGAHVPTTVRPPPPAKPPPAPPPPNPWTGPNRGNTTVGPVNDFAHNPFPANPDPLRGPRDDRDVGSRTIGGSPRNTGAVPGGPLINRPIGGSPQGNDVPQTPAGNLNPNQLAVLNASRAAFGLPPKTSSPAPGSRSAALPGAPGIPRPPSAGAMTTGPAGDRYVQPAGRPAGSAVKPTPAIPKPGTGILGLAAHPLYPVGQAGAPKATPAAPAPVKPATPLAAKPVTPAATGAPKGDRGATPAPRPAPAPPAPATTPARPPQPLQAPAAVATTRPTSAPAPATTLGGVAKPVVYANPNAKTVAPMPKASIMTTVQHGSGGNR